MRLKNKDIDITIEKGRKYILPIIKESFTDLEELDVFGESIGSDEFLETPDDIEPLNPMEF